MRVALLIYGSLDGLSGGYLYDRKLVDTLRSCGDQVEIVSLPAGSYLRHLGDNLSLSLCGRLARLETDLLLQDELNHPSLFWLNRRLRRRLDYPLISVVHHLRSEEAHPGGLKYLYRLVERAYLASVDGFVFNSQATSATVNALLGSSKPGLVAHPAGDHLSHGIRESEIVRRVGEDGPLRLLFVGNLIPRKGLDTLLEALERLPAGEWRLTVVGSQEADSGYARAVRRRVEAGGLNSQVRFTGSVTSDELVRWMRTAQLLIVPSTYEGFGIVYLEAMGFGLPAIACKAGGAGEIVRHGVNGYLLAPGDAASLSDHLLELTQDRGRLLNMSLAARRTYLGHPTWSQTGERIRSFLTEFIT
jgi:glycosyltransferase involved in cell wall biosynthesis